MLTSNPVSHELTAPLYEAEAAMRARLCSQLSKLASWSLLAWPFLFNIVFCDAVNASRPFDVDSHKVSI